VICLSFSQRLIKKKNGFLILIVSKSPTLSFPREGEDNWEFLRGLQPFLNEEVPYGSSQDEGDNRGEGGSEVGPHGLDLTYRKGHRISGHKEGVRATR
jgi:hypothetical protein